MDKGLVLYSDSEEENDELITDNGSDQKLDNDETIPTSSSDGNEWLKSKPDRKRKISDLDEIEELKSTSYKLK